MVVFTCQHCGTSVKKNAVEKHLMQCRNIPFLTCIDCLKDFKKKEYMKHTACVTEDQRYGGKGFKPKPVAVKQNEWMNICHKVLESNTSLSSQQKKMLTLCTNYPNVPRNEKKFLNFISNVGQDMRKQIPLAKSVFQLINNAYKEEKALKSDKGNESSSGADCTNNQNGESQVELKENNESIKHHKKSKKEKVLNGAGPSDDSLDIKNTSEMKLSKKEKKKLKLQTENSSPNENDNELHDDVNGENVNNLNSETLEGVSLSAEISTEKIAEVQSEGLSKKERKRKRKQEKYEAEIKSIEENQQMEEDGNTCEDSGVSKKKKKKKRALEEPENDVNGTTVSTEDVGTKKRKQKLDSSFIGNSGIEVEEPTGKFDWQETIIKILQSSSDKEMSLKKLSKKVIAEYQFQKGSVENHEKVAAKCNKKIHHTVGVRVLKDRAKLILTDGQMVS